MSGFRRLLVPLDGSVEAERALEYLDRLATNEADVVLLRATPTPATLNTMAGVPAPGVIDIAATGDEVCREAVSYLDDAKRGLSERGLRATSAVAYGPATDVIIHHAREMGADLIVMATHARGGIERVVYGSVADSVARHASCAVFLVPVREGEHAAVTRPQP